MSAVDITVECWVISSVVREVDTLPNPLQKDRYTFEVQSCVQIVCA